MVLWVKGEGERRVSFEKYDDKDKLLKLIDDFSEITSIGELASVVYVIIRIHRDRFSYEEEDFDDFGSLGPASRRLFEDVFHLEVREEYIERRSRMSLTLKGKERISQLSEEISFRDVRDVLSQVDKDLWPKLAVFLYLRHKYDIEQARRILRKGYNVDGRSLKILSSLISKLAF